MMCPRRSGWLLSRAALLGFALVVGWPVLAAPAQDTAAATPSATPPQPSAGSSSEASEVLSLESGDMTRVSVDHVERVAISQPDVIDLTVMSPNEVLVQAKAAGRSNLMIWDRHGQRTWAVDVVDRGQEHAELHVRKLLEQMHIPGVVVTKEEGRVYLTGTVTRAEDLEQVEKALESFPTVKNLVRFEEVQPPAPPPPPLVKLAVQVVDVSRTDLEQLGVSWSQSVALTQEKGTDLSVSEALTRFGTTAGPSATGVTRGSLAATLNALVQRNRARVLAEPKLVTTSGKQASSFIGVEVPVIKATSVSSESAAVSASIEFRQTGVVLNMTPYVHPKAPNGPSGDRQITTVITAEVSDVDASVGLSIPVGTKSIAVPGFQVRRASTEVTTSSGESIVIAGLLKAEDTRTSSQVPALGSVPFLGRLFRSPETKSTQRELVIVVTPELMASEEAAPGLVTDRTVQLEEALDVAQIHVTRPTQDPTLQYALTIQERIARAIRYPSDEEGDLGLGREVRLRIHVFRDGTLGRALVAESSGVEAFDREVLKATETQSPFPPFPAHMPQQDVWLELPILFRP